MSDEHDPSVWVARAEEDYAIMNLSMKRKTPLAYGATFHAQQCAEKYLKALLVSQGGAFSRVHDLVILSDECARAGIPVPISQDHLSSLSFYAVRVRYPGETPTADEAREAVKIAQEVRRFARRALGLRR